MTGAEILMLAQIAATLGQAAFDFLSRISEGRIPTYSELMKLNDEVQAKIDSQKPK